MPTPPRQRFYNRLNKLHRDLRQTRTEYSTICPKHHARYAINQIEQICNRDITSQSAIFRAQNEVTDALTDVAFALENLSDADWSRADVPNRAINACSSADIAVTLLTSQIIKNTPKRLQTFISTKKLVA